MMPPVLKPSISFAAIRICAPAWTRLAALVETQTWNKPYVPDTLYLFCGRRTDRIKGLVWEGDGKIIFFNESEAVATEKSGEDPEAVPRRKPKKKQGKREEDLEGLPVVVIEHSLTQDELKERFGGGRL